MKQISLIVPCFNEQDSIRFFVEKVEEIFLQLPNYSYEIVFINDGSKDRTKEVILDLSNINKKIKLVDLARNFGKEIALAAGLDYCSGNAVIPMDVDMQDPPEVIIDFINKWEEGYDVVYGIREERVGDTFLKKLTAFLFYRVINLLSDTKIPKDTGDFRLMDKKVVEVLKQMKERHRFMKGIFAWVGFNQTGIPYVRKPRVSGQSKFNFIKLSALALEGITSFSVRPLKLASFFGFFTSVVAFVYGSYIIIRSLINGSDVPGYPSLIVIILFLGGIQLISVGLLGEYIGRIYNETKERPLYIVNQAYGFTN